MPRNLSPRFRKTLLALAAGAVLTPHGGAWALELATAPPGTVVPYVAPNVILSLDDSTSMDAKDMVLKDPTKPYNESSNPYTKTRVQVLQEALQTVFNDNVLLPDEKLRLAWQSLGNCTSVDGLSFQTLGTGAAATTAANTMRVLDKNHRTNFINYAKNYTTCSSTPTHRMVKRADEYMRAPLHQNGPWASKPGETLNGPKGKPLGCRRNYHILLTDGGWNGDYFGPGDTYFSYKSPYYEATNWDDPKEDINTDPINFDNQDSKTFKAYGKSAATPAKAGTGQLPDPLGIDPQEDPKDYPGFALPDGTPYSRDDPNTWVYRDIDYLTYSSWHEGYRPCRTFQLVNTGTSSKPKWVKQCTDIQNDGSRRGGVISTLSDWTFKSWATRLQNKDVLDGQVIPAPEYDKAIATETFTNPKTGKKATLKKYWNPRYNPATWAHMVTFTIGFSKDSLPSTQYRPMGDNSQTAGNIGKYWRDGTAGSNNYWGSTTGLFYYMTGPKPADSNEATTDNGNSGNLIKPSSTMPYGYDGSFADYAAGRAQWYSIKQPAEDMWHAAINGRGQFYAVEKGEDLKEAFRQIVKTISGDVDPNLSASATSGSNASRSDVGKYTAYYEPLKGWKGSVTADRVKSDGATEPDPGWNGKNTADKIDAMDVNTRLVLSWSDQWASSKPTGGVPFNWDSAFSAAQKLSMQKNSSGSDEGATKGQQRLEYIRGNRDLEGSESTGYTALKPYRQRQSRQGDIVNSDVWYTGAPAGNSLLKGYADFVRDNKSRPGMLYVGGNDGMLHGFAAADGQEKIAYVPRGVIPNLTKLTDPAYNDKHMYFVDGSPMTGDVDINGGKQDPKDADYAGYTPDWRTLLVGTLGLGGKGYFVLDVTNPTGTTPTGGAPGFDKNNAAQLVKLDRTRAPDGDTPDCSAMASGPEKTACLKTAAEDKDIGYITAKPVRDENDSMRSTQITRLNNNRWAVVMGNGYNSTNQRPVLLIQYLDDQKELVRIPAVGTVDQPPTPGTGRAQDNGLAAPRVVDLNGDGRADVAYAGDNQGNLWKFDLTSASPGDWKVAFGGEPLFTAEGFAGSESQSRDQSQPISAPPTVRANDRMITKGSGASAKTWRVGGMMVAFGTGRNVAKTDPEKISVQTLYSVLDNTRYREVGTGANKRLEVHPGNAGCNEKESNCVPVPKALGKGVAAAKLAKQVFVDGGTSEYDAIKPDGDANELKSDTWSKLNGWYLDLPASGERLLKGMEFYDASNLLTVWSQVPAKGLTGTSNGESCDATSVDEERQYRTFINIMDGKAPSVALVDKNKNNKFNMADGDGVSVGGKYISISRKQVAKGPHTIISTGKYENVDIDAKNNKEKLARMPEESLRPSWRQLR